MTTNLVRRRIVTSRPTMFTSRFLLQGTAPLVIPAGTTVRVSGPRPSLDFQGYNTLSVWASIADFDVGDALTLRVNTVDPESNVAALIPSDLGMRELITVLGNGEVAQVLNLIDFYSGAGNQPLLLQNDIADGGWGGQNGAVFPNLYTNLNNPNPTDADYIKLLSGQGGVYIGEFSPAVDPGILGPFSLQFRGRDTSSGGTHKIGVTISDAANNTLWNGTNAQNWPATNFSTLTYVVTFGMAPSSWTGLRIGIGGGLNIPPSDGEQQVSLAELIVGGGTPPGQLLAIPFYRNVFEWKNTGATDVTVTSMAAELTNA